MCFCHCVGYRLLPKDYHKDMRSRGDFSCMVRRIIETELGSLAMQET